VFLPYRAKNPPERFPYVTLGLIAANTLIYAATSEYFLVVRRSVVQDFAVSHEHFTFTRLFSAMFLHGDPLHLIGNMLFLWLFGASVEGRLKPFKFVGVYLAAGLAGGVLQDLVMGLVAPKQFGLGASGAIMGLAGAYFYLFPYSTVCCFWLYYYRAGVCEWQARWVIGLYVGLDLLYGFLWKGVGISGGVAHFAHLGGFGCGLLVTLALRAKRDSEEYSDAQAVRSDMKGNYSILSAQELEALMPGADDNVPLILAYVKKCVTQYDGKGAQAALAAVRQHERVLLERADGDDLARLILSVPVSGESLPPVFYLRLAGKAETSGNYETALLLYRRIFDINPQAPDAEMALLRTGRLSEQMSANKASAAAPYYAEMLRRFPAGPLADQARIALLRLRVPLPAASAPDTAADRIVFSAGNAGAPPVAAPVSPPVTATTAPADALNDMAPVGASAATHPAFAPPIASPIAGRARDAAPPDDDLRPLGG